MDNGAEEQSAVMLFERNDRLVCDAFRNGDLLRTLHGLTEPSCHVGEDRE